jgi:acyl-CoA synthetase (AMP-forming)/AMP-acid ligase II
MTTLPEPHTAATAPPDLLDELVEPTVPALVELLARRYGDEEAVVGPEGRLRFRDLAHRAGRLAAFYAAAGLRPGDRVAVLLPNGCRWLVAALGALRAGLVVVPTNTWYRAPELAHVLHTAQIRLVVTDERVFGRDVPAELGAAGHPQRYAGPGEGYLGCVTWSAEEELPAPARGTAVVPPLMSRADDLALVLFTSGSTARPKPVPLRHGPLLRNGREIGRRQHLRAGDRLWISAPFFFGYGCANALPVALTHAVTLCVEERVDGDRSPAFIERERCTVYYGLAPTTRVLVNSPSLRTRDISSLRTGTTGFTPEDKRLVIEELGVTEVCSMYGLTEGYGHSAVSDAHDPAEVRLQTCGTAVPTQEIRVTDDDGDPRPAGTVGEIELRGCVIDGYLGDPELNRDLFRPGGWFRTGDLGFLDGESRLHFVGRRKEMLKVKGINIAPVEVEELLGTHHAVDQAHVVGLPDPGGDEEMVAVVVPRKAADDDLPAQLVAHLRARAASYKVPSRFVLMDGADLPLTDTGKVSKRLLKARLEVEHDA